MEQRAIRIVLIAIVTGVLALTGACNKNDGPSLRNEQFALNPVGNSGISGTVYVAENLDSSFNVTIRLNSSVKDSVHVMNIYNVYQNNSTNISVKLADIKGTGGAVVGETKSIKQAVEETGSFSTVTYDKVLKQTRIVKVFLSRNMKDSVLCIGEIGR
jgi:hypothetical protein